MSVLDKITMGDLDENQQQVAETVGLDNYKKLVAAYGGMSIYIPKPDQFGAGSTRPAPGWPAYFPVKSNTKTLYLTACVV